MAELHAAYHAHIDAFVQEMRGHADVRGLPVVYDIHCQGSQLKAVLRGTHNGETCRPHVEKFGEGFVTGEEAFFTVLEDRGVYVDPPARLPLCCVPRELESFLGGYTLKKYGGLAGTADGGSDAYAADPVTCLQLEAGTLLKETPEEIDELGSHYAYGMVSAAESFA
eukprot:Rhum_TRINITY_DN14743_c0_g1::Rhum_TRINITY_DN14743_c0_g1_i2::g.112991::m.112991